jgi:hypothetical protein
MGQTNSGGQATLPCQSWETVAVSGSNYVATGEDWPIAFIQDTTAPVSFRCIATGNTITRTFAGGVIHYIGAFDTIFDSGTTATSITVGRP